MTEELPCAPPFNGALAALRACIAGSLALPRAGNKFRRITWCPEHKEKVASGCCWRCHCPWYPGSRWPPRHSDPASSGETCPLPVTFLDPQNNINVPYVLGSISFKSSQRLPFLGSPLCPPPVRFKVFELSFKDYWGSSLPGSFRFPPSFGFHPATQPSPEAKKQKSQLTDGQAVGSAGGGGGEDYLIKCSWNHPQ